MRAYRCDRCNRHFDEIPESIYGAVSYKGAMTRIDLCPKCQAEYENWMNRRPLRWKPTTEETDPKLDPEINGGFRFE